MTKDKKKKLQGAYILQALKEYFLNGDAFVYAEEVHEICKKFSRDVIYSVFCDDFKFLLQQGYLCREGRRIYLESTLRYENAAAASLAEIMRSNRAYYSPLPEVITVCGGLPLCQEQVEAVRMAVSCRLSIILGGAGTGKSTLIQAIMKCTPPDMGRVACAPTGKAARNLAERTGCIVRTVHSALGVRSNDDFLAPVRWERVGLVVVDEASMMTLGMLAGILQKVRKDCRVVLVGDYNQLLSVGSGNVLPDLLRIGIPHIRLLENHRQAGEAAELLANVRGFSDIHYEKDFAYGDSFQLQCMGEAGVKEALVDEAVRRYLAGENLLVLSPYNFATGLSVANLNHAIRERVNPEIEGMKKFPNGFRNGDRVIITQNDRDRDCSNGDVGILNIIDDDLEEPLYQVALPDGRTPTWHNMSGFQHMALAYALTVHKSQGSEYDCILMPIVDSFNSMMCRNLVYTAISRGRKQVILYGSRNALSVAVQRSAKERRSQLVQKCGMESTQCA